MKKTKKQAKAYKIALSTLTTTAIIGTGFGIGANVTINKIEKTSYSNVSRDNKFESFNIEHDAADPFLDNTFDLTNYRDAADDPVMPSWYNAGAKYYVEKNSTLEQKHFVTDITKAEGYPLTYKLDGKSFEMPDAVKNLDPAESSNWGWKEHKGHWDYWDGGAVHNGGVYWAGSRNQCATLFMDSSHTLWFGKAGIGLYHRDASNIDITTGWVLDTSFKSGVDTNLFSMIEDHNHVLWATGYHGKMKYKKVDETTWHDVDPSCKILGEQESILFEDSKHTIWASGWKHGLQYKKEGEVIWHDAPGNNIKEGRLSTILEQKNSKTLWAMGVGTGLQYKLANEDEWHDAASNCKITSGQSRNNLAEESDGTLWAIGVGTGLQYKKPTEDDWHDADASCAAVGDGGGRIFVDSHDNVWVVGKKSLWIKPKEKSVWQDMGYGADGSTIIEDSNHVVWYQGRYIGLSGLDISSPLPDTIPPMLKWQRQASAWLAAGYWGDALEDTITGMIYHTSVTCTRGNGDGLEVVVKATPKDWYWTQTFGGVELPEIKQDMDSPHTAANPPRGRDKRITFESPDNIDITKFIGTPGKIKIDGKEYDYVKQPSQISVTVSDITYKGATDGKLLISKTDDPNSILKISKNNGDWEDVTPGAIEGLAEGTLCQLKWVAKPGVEYLETMGTEEMIGTYEIKGSNKINTPKQPSFIPTAPSAKDAVDGTIEVGNFKDTYSKLQYKLSTDVDWTDVPASGHIEKLKSGIYSFQWISNNDEKYVGGNKTKIDAGTCTIDSSIKIKAPTGTLTFKPITPTIKGASDGEIEAANFKDTYSKLQYKLLTDVDWTDVPASGHIEKLKSGTYQFQWIGIGGEEYTDGSKTHEVVNRATVAESNIVNPPADIKISSTNSTYKGAADGEISISNIVDPNSKLKMSSDGGRTWTDVPADPSNANKGLIEDLAKGASYQFKWVANNGLKYTDNGNEKVVPGTFVISETNKIEDSFITPTFKTFSPTIKGASDGEIEVANFKDTYSKLQYKLLADVDWTDVPTSGHIEKLKSGTYQFQWIGIGGEEYTDGSKTHEVVNRATVAESNIVNPPADIKISSTNSTYKGAVDGEISISNIVDPNSKLKMSSDGGRTWTDVPADPSNANKGLIEGLAKGASYQFKWVANNGLKYTDNGNEKVVPGTFVISETNKIMLPSANPTFKSEVPSLKGAGDGKIEVEYFDDKYSKLQYKLSSTSDWIDVGSSGLIENLKHGTYNFRWVGKDGEEYTNGSKAISLKDIVVEESRHISSPLEPVITIKPLTAVGAIDGEISVNTYTDAYSKLQYKLAAEADTEWKEIPKSGLDLTKLGETIFNFRWVPISSSDSYLVDGNEEVSISLEDRKIDASSLVDIPANPTLTPTSPTTLVANDGTIKVENFKDGSGKAVLKYSVNGSPFEDVTGDIENLAPKSNVKFEWVLINQEENFTNGLKESQAGIVTIGDSVNIPLPSISPQFVNTNVSEEGKADGSIHVTNNIDLYSELKFRKVTSDDSGLWKLVPVDGKIDGLVVGTYEFKWTPKAGYGTYPDSSTEDIIKDTSSIETKCSIEIKTNTISGNDNEKIDSSISSAKVEFVENFYHDFAIFRVSHVGEDISEISYIDYQNPTPQLVNSIEEASSSNQLVTKLNMADGTTIYLVETEQDGKRTVVVEKIDKNGKWLSAMKAEKVGEGTYKMLSDTDDILNTFKSQKSEYGKLIFHMVKEISDNSNSQDDETSSTDEPNDAQALSEHHIWNLANKPKPVDAFVEQMDDAIAISYGNVRAKLDASKLNGLSGDLATSNNSSSFPWWTLSFLALPPIAGILWFVLRKRRKAKD